MRYLRFAVLAVIVVAALTLSLSGVSATERQPDVPQGDFVVGTFSSSPGAAIPDNTPGGVGDTIAVTAAGTINDVNVTLGITHTWVGDLAVTITSPAGTSVTIVDRPGVPASPFGCSEDNMNTSLDDESTNGSIENACPISLADYVPNNALSAFDGEDINGTWSILVVDNAGGDTGTLDSWSLVVDYTGAAVGGINVPHLGMIQIDAWAPVVAYDGPAGSQVHLADGTALVLPHDYDGSGADTHIVTEVATVDGRTWVSIFIGNENFVWVALDQVTPIYLP